MIIYDESNRYENFEICNGYVYTLNSLSSSPFKKINLNTLKEVNSYQTLINTNPQKGMLIINNIIFFIGGGIYRNILSKKVYSDEKGEEL